jgi:replicative DNA helicase
MAVSASTLLLKRMTERGETGSVLEYGITQEDFPASEQTSFDVLRDHFEARGFGTAHIQVHALRTHFNTIAEDPSRTTADLCAEVRMRRIRTESDNLLESVKKLTSKGKVEEALRALHEKSGRLLSFATKTQDLSFRNGVSECLGIYEKRKDARLSGQTMHKFSLPWKTFQDAAGGIEEEDFYVFYGRPKSKKTWVLCSIIAHMFLQGFRVLVYTKEMTPVNIMQRILTCMMEIPYGALRHGNLSAPDEERLFAFRESMLDPKGNLDVLSGQDVKDGRDTIGWLGTKIANYAPDVVFVDGLYLMSTSSSSKAQADWQRVMGISREARQLVLATKKPILCTMQANRGAAKHSNADASEISYSDALGQDATGIFRVMRAKDEIYLACGGSREYSLEGWKIGGIPATDFKDKGVLTLADIHELMSVDDAPETSKKKRALNQTADSVVPPVPAIEMVQQVSAAFASVGQPSETRLIVAPPAPRIIQPRRPVRPVRPGVAA